MLKYTGFIFLEAVLALLLVASVGLAVYQLQISIISATQQSVTRQLAIEAAVNLLDQIYPHLNYTIGIKREPGAMAYLEANANLHTDSYQFCTGTNTNCNDKQFANAVLTNWKAGLAKNLNLSSGSVCAQICNDNPLELTIPKYTTGCNISFCRQCKTNCGLYLKIAWFSHLEQQEAKLIKDNFVILRIPVR